MLERWNRFAWPGPTLKAVCNILTQPHSHTLNTRSTHTSIAVQIFSAHAAKQQQLSQVSDWLCVCVFVCPGNSSMNVSSLSTHQFENNNWKLQQLEIFVRFSAPRSMRNKSAATERRKRSKSNGQNVKNTRKKMPSNYLQQLLHSLLLLLLDSLLPVQHSEIKLCILLLFARLRLN